MTLQGLFGAVPLAHFFLRERISPGDRVVDATCGNGQDTLLLAELVGRDGRVWAFDVQEEALVKTKERLTTGGVEERVELLHAGHERLEEFVAGPVKAVIFNLGYLPTGDREIKTTVETTLLALEQAKKLLLPSGIILIAVYTGHEGGGEEWLAVKGWAESLSPHEFNAWQSRQLNRSERAPFLVVVEKMPVVADFVNMNSE